MPKRVTMNGVARVGFAAICAYIATHTWLAGMEVWTGVWVTLGLLGLAFGRDRG